MVLPYQCTLDDIQWAGLACSEDEPCPIYLELSAAESSGARMFVAGNIHSSTVTLYSVLLGSEDSGHTWREAHARIRGAGLDHIQFVDTATGWVGGEILFPLAQDPFLLFTGDGGRTWRQRPIFGEPSDGSLVEFQFTSRTGGSVILDRGAGNGRRALCSLRIARWRRNLGFPAGERPASPSGAGGRADCRAVLRLARARRRARPRPSAWNAWTGNAGAA